MIKNNNFYIDNEETIYKMADVFKQLSDGTRLKILNEILNERQCVGYIAEKLKMSQPIVSHHLKQLKLSNIISSSREGKEVYYSLHCNSIKILLENCIKHINEH